MKSRFLSYAPIVLALIVSILVLGVLAASPPYREEPNPSAFIDFVSGSFLVDPAQGQTVVPITNSAWSVVENPTSVLSFENDKIYILQAGVRVKISGALDCTSGNNTWAQAGIVVRNGSGAYLPTSAPVVVPKAAATQLDFFAMLARATLESDFTGGNPYIQVIVRHNATSVLSCKLHIEISVQ